MTAAIGLLRELVEAFGDEPCRFDHNQFCQEHYCSSPCIVARTREFLRVSTPRPMTYDPNSVDLDAHTS